MASIFAKSLSVGCCLEIAEAWKLRNKIGEACCCNLNLLHFLEKSSIERLAALTSSFHREELLNVDDHR